MKYKYYKLIGLISLILLVHQIADYSIIQHIADKNWISSYVSEHGILGTVVLLLTGIVFMGCGGPRQIIAFLFGYTYGIALGLTYGVICSLISAGLCYWLARIHLKDWLALVIPTQLQYFQYHVKQQPFKKVLLLRLLPLGSNVLTNLCSGLIAVPFKEFIFASFVGYLPQTLIFSLAGGGINTNSSLQVILSIVLGIVSLLLTAHLYKAHKVTSK